jgi:hypothetical protein
MSTLYWFAMVVGVGMYLFSVFADVSGDADVGVDGDLDVGGHGHAHGVDGYQILSLRNATYFLFAFGVTGVALRWLWGGGRGLLTAGLAISVGLLGAMMSSLVFGWLRKSESGNMPGDQTWIGAAADVVLPLVPDGTGKVYASRGGRTQELLARPFDAGAEHPERWTSVLILDIKDGIALVAPHDQSLGHVTPRGGAPRLGEAGPDAQRPDSSTET